MRRGERIRKPSLVVSDTYDFGDGDQGGWFRDPVASEGWPANSVITEQYTAEYRGKPNLILEIGVLTGSSATWFADNLMDHPDSYIHLVDPFAAGETGVVTYSCGSGLCQMNMMKSKAPDRWKLHQVTSNQFFEGRMGPTFDVVYIDGDHHAHQVYLDAVHSWDLLNPGGVILFDDYSWKLENDPSDRPRDGIDRFIEEFNPAVLYTGWMAIVKKGVS